MYLRRTFTSVYVTSDGRAIDTHKHYVEAASHSEHAWFIEQLVNDPGGLDAIARGPKHSKAVRKVNKGDRRSQGPHTVLTSASQRGPIDDPVPSNAVLTEDFLMHFFLSGGCISRLRTEGGKPL